MPWTWIQQAWIIKEQSWIQPYLQCSSGKDLCLSLSLNGASGPEAEVLEVELPDVIKAIKANWYTQGIHCISCS